MTTHRFFLWVMLSCIPLAVCAYPLDADDAGIGRLAGFRLAQEHRSGSKLPPGALLGSNDIRLHLLQLKEWDLDATQQDPRLQAALQKTFGGRDPSYGEHPLGRGARKPGPGAGKCRQSTLHAGLFRRPAAGVSGYRGTPACAARARGGGGRLGDPR